MTHTKWRSLVIIRYECALSATLGRRRRKVSEVRAKIAYHLSREMGLPQAEIVRKVDVGTSAVAMAIRKKEQARNK
jgi:hypothetical protein